MREIERYYDKYSQFYDEERGHKYYQMINYLEIDLLKKYIGGKKVLEVGCGTGMILEEVQKVTKEAYGVDASKDMIKKAIKKKLNVQTADVTKLPFEDKSFDVVYSFKVLAHVPDIKKAIKEIMRVTEKNGTIILEFYNPYSLKHIVNKVDNTFFSKRKVYIRYDSYFKIKKYLPREVKIIKTRGIRIFTPLGFLFKMPFISNLLFWLEKTSCDSILRFFGGFFVVILKFKDELHRTKV